MTQFYKLTLEAAIAHYQQGDLTAKGLIHIYLLIKCKPGWKIKLEHKKICKELGIQKTAFYNGISRLKAEGSIAWESPEGILVSISESFRKCGIQFRERGTAVRECGKQIFKIRISQRIPRSSRFLSDIY